MGAGSSAGGPRRGEANLQTRSQSMSGKHRNSDALAGPSATVDKSKKKGFPFPANNEDDYKTALELQKENPEMMKVFIGMHEFVDKLVECEKKKNWAWVTLQDQLENCFEDAYFEFYKKKKVLGLYLALLKAADPLAKAYGDALDAGQLKAFTAKTVEDHDADEILGFLISTRAVLLNYTDSSYLFCERVSDSGIFKYFVADLKEDGNNIEHFDETVDDCFLSSMGILYNCSRNPITRQNLRQYDIASVLLPFLKCESEKVRIIVLISLANMLDEDQNDLLLADDSVFDFLIFILKSSMAVNSRRYDGMSVEEIVDGMTGLAKNDSNKSLLVKKGVLPLLIELMREGANNEEIERAVKCVWELAFDKNNKKEFNKHKELMDLLKKCKGSEDRKTAKAAEGALWTLQMETKDKNKKQDVLVTCSGHVMISYQWGDQKVLLQVKEHLKQNGFIVWMDIDNMGGSTLQAMAEAVQNSAVVLVCMSERYKESQNCRSEAEYAFSLQKAIVPILTQRDYKPDGWLGMIKGTKLFFDLSGKYDFVKKVNELVRELGQRGKGMEADEIDGEQKTMVPVLKSAPADVSKGPPSGTAAWSNKDVTNWLVQVGLSRQSSLKSLTGEDLVFLKKLSYKAPEFFYTYVKDELQLKDLRDIRRFTEAVEKLS